ncbi:hypothetical protein Riv7116_5141 [Rivularia sp. PCC 7116]|uniref:hypothetical protein n=1 Tax=Rivularia sp. PCC 7116 TaxID=373994 RepID=UPI00029ED5B2|nr:hypothetical protein [Rivularia sp. PCC 7116]AFY57538.1 hypothetical protein Riv7116_5141 [Rivularia sp. PCC 7116]
MIHHISIPAKNPAHVASVLAELFNSKYCAPFPSHEGSYVALAGDEYGTVIEVYPLGTQMTPGEDDKPIQFQLENNPNQFIATHAAMSIPLNQSQIEAIAEREQWRCVRFSRGEFDVIEFWVENTVLLELATPELAEQYTTAFKPEKIAEYFAPKNS